MAVSAPTHTSARTAEEQIIARLERDLRGLRDSDLAAQREITRLTQANDALNEQLRDANDRIASVSRDVEHLYLGASMDLERQADRFNAVRRIRERLDPMIAQSPPFTVHSPPRIAAGAH